MVGAHTSSFFKRDERTKPKGVDVGACAFVNACKARLCQPGAALLHGGAMLAG